MKNHECLLILVLGIIIMYFLSNNNNNNNNCSQQNNNCLQQNNNCSQQNNLIKEQFNIYVQKNPEDSMQEQSNVYVPPGIGFGFIILRHVNNEISSHYWSVCYDRIRRFYPETPIVIIDDNSTYEFIDSKKEAALYKCLILRSIFPKRGELLPYYYYIHNKWFDSALIIHDSVFINIYI